MADGAARAAVCVREERMGTCLYSRERSVASMWCHPGDRCTRGVGGNAQWRAVAPAANGARRSAHRRVWPRHLALPKWPWTSRTGARRHSAVTAGHSGPSACVPDVSSPGATSCAGARVCTINLIYPFSHRIFSRFRNRSGLNFEHQSCSTSYQLQKCRRLYRVLPTRLSRNISAQQPKTQRLWIVIQCLHLHFSRACTPN
jgi:hypothetical protein